jgi:hypothetical protein
MMVLLDMRIKNPKGAWGYLAEVQLYGENQKAVPIGNNY